MQKTYQPTQYSDILKKDTLSAHEYALWQVERSNSLPGDFSDCPKCMGRGWFHGLHDTPFGKDLEYVTPCECRIKKTRQRRANASGRVIDIEKTSLDKLTITYPWQAHMKETAERFINSPNKLVLYCSGQTGCGKTTLCNAVWAKLICDGYKSVYMLWMQETRSLKEITNTPEYSTRYNELMNTDLLFIDDFLKTIGNTTPSVADLRLARELIDARMLNGKATIITSEFSINDIASFDESLSSRLYLATNKGQHSIYVNNGKNLRY